SERANVSFVVGLVQQVKRISPELDLAGSLPLVRRLVKDELLDETQVHVGPTRTISRIPPYVPRPRQDQPVDARRTDRHQAAASHGLGAVIEHTGSPPNHASIDAERIEGRTGIDQARAIVRHAVMVVVKSCLYV